MATLRNARRDCNKPNEDRYALDPVRGSVVLADGITRTVKEDGSYPTPSPSAQVADIFCSTVSDFLRKASTISEDTLHAAITAGNGAIAAFNHERFPNPDYARQDMAGVAAIVAVVAGDLLWVASIADCICLAVVPPNVTTLVDEKTSRSVPEYKRLGEIEARKALRNKAHSPYAYGALTGEKEALPFVQYQRFRIDQAQRLVFTSDGLLELAKRSPNIFTEPAQQILTAACALDDEINYTDDKTIVILDRRSRD